MSEMKTYQEKISKELNVTPEKAWEVIGAVGGVDKWFNSLIKNCRVDGNKRYCETGEGHKFTEDILEVNHEARIFKYAIPKQDMLPVENIMGTMTVDSNNDGLAIVGWSATFESTPENAKMAQEAFVNLWDMGLKEMETYINND